MAESIDYDAIKALAVRAAQELGAGDVRVVQAFSDEATRERMRESFARGDLTTWRYGERYARMAADPSTLLANAKAVVCVAVPYSNGEMVTKEPLRGRVSNYAWFGDYHVRMRLLLTEIAQRIDAAAGEPVTAVACDTRPLAERAFAARAGLGWVGKHTNLISPALGSFVFLGEIVTTLPLPVDAPLKKTCGACVRCVQACPTQALRGDYTIDARRCIADLTQRTDGIPRELRPLLGMWVWGCDICQIVCPPTRLAAKRSIDARSPESESAMPSLVSLLSLRSGDFRRRFARSAMGWRGAAVLRRNAAVALGNALDRSAVGALASRLEEDPHPMVRGHVAWALGRIGSPSAISALQRRYGVETHPEVREEILAALASLFVKETNGTYATHARRACNAGRRGSGRR
jgi:epoxyqueuosine reductase